ncbi:hypothetical protein FN976_19660 [Caenimonas sedimenti]|uniref:Uncharacterized protein n=1 Tax=Caenimonas sedimenti TaxID=2596921 RepID=A0A562ZMW2_9BURK|nr:hypothetical protein [Caenimonas sedimenti]TWO69504.1 hypothetical protein FN976_19660 [Caenimonas sedimenti]
MTAIAALSCGEIPVVIGDLLVTRATVIPGAVPIPALGDASDFFGGAWAIAGLKQKVVLVNDDCVIAWAGSWVSARVALHDLREWLGYRVPSADEVVKFFQRHTDVKAHGNEFVGWVHEGGYVRQFGYQAERQYNTRFGTIVAGGSGSFAMREAAAHAPRIAPQFGHANAVDIAQLTGHLFGSMLLRAEFHGGDAAPTIRHFFGGGYEVAHRTDGRFAKLGDVTFYIWEAAFSGEDLRLSAPQFVLKQDYCGDFLLIRSVQVKEDGSGRLTIAEEQRHVIEPMIFAAEPADLGSRLSNLELQSSVSVHCIAVRGTVDPTLAFVVERVGMLDRPNFSVSEGQGKVEFRIEQQFLSRISDQIKGELRR